MTNMRILAAGLAIAVAVSGVAFAERRPGPSEPHPPAENVVSRDLSCLDLSNDSDAVHERKLLRAAPPDVKRVSDHLLTVSTKSGVKRFADKKPYREELGGFHWHYCGYIPVLGAYLIGMDDEDLFSGKLLLNGSGRLLDAGRTVYPSPDGKLFLAAEQHDGKELKDWVLSDLSGRRLWAGESGIVKNDLVLQEFEAPHWIGDNALQVTATCGDRAGTKGQAALARDGERWRWKSDARCKD